MAKQPGASGFEGLKQLSDGDLDQVEKMVSRPDLHRRRRPVRRQAPPDRRADDDRGRVGEKGTLAFSIQLKDVDKPVTITPPASGRPLEELMQKLQQDFGAHRAGGDHDLLGARISSDPGEGRLTFIRVLTKLRTSITAVAILAATPRLPRPRAAGHHARRHRAELHRAGPAQGEDRAPDLPDGQDVHLVVPGRGHHHRPSLQLSLADGDVASGSKRGRLASGSKLLPLPVEARVGRTAFAPLNLAVDTPLIRFTGPLSRGKATVNLRQSVEKKAAGSYRKLVLVTVSLDTP